MKKIILSESNKKIIVSAFSLENEDLDALDVTLLGLKARDVYLRNYANRNQAINIYSLPTFLYILQTNDILKEIPLYISEKVQSIIEAHKKCVVKLLRKIDELQVFNTTYRLFDYQLDGTLWLLYNKKGLLADEMGLGKTPQALMAIPEKSKTIVICPAIAKNVWLKMCKDWRPDLSPVIYKGRQKQLPTPIEGELSILNPEIVPEIENKIDYDILIVDEAAMIKSYSAGKNKKILRTEKIRKIAKNTDRVYLLTGTPMFAKPGELWKVILPTGWHRRAFKDYNDFEYGFSPEQEGFKTIYNAPDDATIISLSQGMLRRTKAEVLPSLPDKIYQEIEVSISKDIIKQCEAAMTIIRERYNNDINRFLSEAHTLSDIARLRLDLAIAKIPSMLEFVETFEENEIPLVVLSQHKKPVEALGERKGWEIITSDISHTQRSKTIDKFQAGKLKGIAITIDAAGTAITLTRASHALFVDRSWTPAMNLQSEDRLHRVGQKNCVNIYDLIADHEIDRLVNKTLRTKSYVVNSTMNKVSNITSKRNLKNIYESVLPLIDNSVQKELSERTAVGYKKYKDTKIYTTDEVKTKLINHIERYTGCDSCNIAACKNGNNYVFYKFYIPCDILMIGEAPGYHEAEKGIPFIGPAGKLFSDAMEDAGFKPGEPPYLGFTNVLICRPYEQAPDKFGNRQPKPEEISNCIVRLIDIIKIANPKKIYAVGRVAEELLKKNSDRIFKNKVVPFEYLVHPSYILRNGGKESNEYISFVSTLSSIRISPLFNPVEVESLF